MAEKLINGPVRVSGGVARSRSVVTRATGVVARTSRLVVVAIVSGLVATVAALNALALGVLENPQPNAKASGVDVSSGYHCDASRVDIEIDGKLIYRAGSGTPRADTQARCGRSNTGFAVLINWSTLGTGPHVVRALGDGVEFARATANVVTLGGEFLQGLTGMMRLDNFPQPGKGVIAEWQESQQNFVIRELLPTVPSINGSWYGPVLEQWSSCNDPNYNGNHGANAIWSVALYDNVTLSINGTIETTPPFTCNYSGTHAMQGTQHVASGTFSCSNGKKGSWRTTDFQVSDRALSLVGDGNWMQSNVACQMKFLIGGYRHLPLQ